MSLCLSFPEPKDHNIGPDHYKLFRFPNQRVQVIDGGHLLYYEMNDAFLKAIVNSSGNDLILHFNDRVPYICSIICTII